jgi:hypothetical protein
MNEKKQTAPKIIKLQPRRWQLAAAAAIAVLMITGGALLVYSAALLHA